MSTVSITSMAMPARRVLTNAGSSKYDLSKLTPGSNDVVLVEGVINTKKAVSRLTSAVASFRKRPGNALSNFAVRTFVGEDGAERTGCWRLADKAAPVEVTLETASAV